jgi:hypothetical protein
MKKPAALPELDHPTLDAESIRRSLYNRLIYTIGKDPITATDRDWFYAAAAVVRERMIERWMETMRSYYIEDRKRVYYLSMEFLMGRTMTNSMLNICAEKEFRDALAAWPRWASNRSNIAEAEPDAALGNGGLGRLAACFLDSMATMGVRRLRLRHPLRIRHVPPGHRGRPAGRAPRQLAALRQSLGVPAPRGALPGQVPRPRGRVRRRTWPQEATSGWTATTSWPWPTTTRFPVTTPAR